ncbi:MAG: hypothetical protein KF900_11030 [Bacteroidetes bacterium]|nr:hypothetical protein [Bacteroidota bacterium]
MLNFLKTKYTKSKGLVIYFFLTYLDRAVSFALPLSILFLLKDKEQYAFVEVVFSYATIAVIAVELGMSSFLFYGYKHAEDKEKFTLNAVVNFKFLLLIYCALSALLFLGAFFYDENLLSLFLLISIRTLFTLYLNFNTNIFRLKDNPAGIYLTSILINVASFFLLMAADYFSWQHKIVYFFLPAFILIGFVCVKFIVLEFRLFNFKLFQNFLSQSLRYSWAIILNAFAMSFINNYAKIYAYGNLSAQEMVQVSYVLRIGLIIQLTHSAFASYFSKSLFMDTAHKLNFKILKQYSAVLLSAAFMVLLIILATNYFFSSQITVPLSMSTFLFLLYIVLWCFVAYLEIYFGVMNANRKVLYYSVISSLVYITLLKIFGNVGVFELSVCMASAGILNLLLVIFGLQKLNVLNLKKQNIPNE